MGENRVIFADVAVIGGGPAGLSACLELAKSSGVKVVLFESEPELGGMPRSCHVFFGMRDMKKIYTGPAYARKLGRLISNTGIDVHTQSTVTQILPGGERGMHSIKAVTRDGVVCCECNYILLATGCFERSREARRIPGSRPAGIFTTGSLQQLVNLQNVKPGREALIVGSEHVALSAALTLKRAGAKIVGLVSDGPELHTYPLAAKAMSTVLGFPIFQGAAVATIFGKRRVEGVCLSRVNNQKQFAVECDTVVFTGKFRPDAALIYQTDIREDPASMGPSVDMDLESSKRGIYAAGNVLRGADMHDICALEGRVAARSILRRLENTRGRDEAPVSIHALDPIRYVVPQTLFPGRIGSWKHSLFRPSISVQVRSTFRKSVLEAWSGDERIWVRRYARLIANTRIPLPIEKMNWGKVDPSKGIVLKLSTFKNARR
ncbi:MAG: NAD(P)/FAD-dependent oxidoreductase [Desulfobacterales bacterium]|nr:NAD(P)/FAD-dependent oxidoreductase [Desulfobacterales bacterium]